MSADKTEENRKPHMISNVLFGCTVREVPKLIPGVLLSVALVALCIWLTDLLNAVLGFRGLVSYILVVISAGILICNIFRVPAIFSPGISIHETLGTLESTLDDFTTTMQDLKKRLK